MFSPAINQLIEKMTCLPGVGKRSAQRMAMHLLEHNRTGGAELAKALQHALMVVESCQHCRNLTEQSLCHICTDQARDNTLMCIVESPSDVIAIEASGGFNGLYFVLKGHLSPLDGIGPDELGLELLQQRVATDFKEVILATNPTVEGEATASYIIDLIARDGLKISRIAHGVPVGGELEFVDGGTLMHALNSRKAL